MYYVIIRTSGTPSAWTDWSFEATNLPTLDAANERWDEICRAKDKTLHGQMDFDLAIVDDEGASEMTDAQSRGERWYPRRLQ